MKNCLSLLAIAAIGSTFSTLTAAEITGKVTLKGTPPAEKEITAFKTDKNCGAAAAGPVMSRNYVASKDGGLANVFVYVKKGLEGKKFDAATESLKIDQVACMYEPYIAGAMAGQKVEIKNSDPFMHNVLCTSKVGNPVFNIAQTRQGQVDTKSFTKPETFVTLQCNVHPWMFSYIGVVEHPFFAVTDKDGKFKLSSKLPAGKYTLEFIHRKAGVFTQEVEVADGAAKEVALTVDAK
jgi:plastocyanin